VPISALRIRSPRLPPGANSAVAVVTWHLPSGARRPRRRR
jgi:hypothetical protein